jgi:hypothetical protein
MSQGYHAQPPVNTLRRSAWADFLIVGGLLILYESLRLHFLKTAGIRASGELDSRLRVMGENLIPGGEWFTTGLILAALVWPMVRDSQPSFIYSLQEIPRILLEGFGIALVIWVGARLWSRMVPELVAFTQEHMAKGVSLLGAAIYEEGVFRILLLAIIYGLLVRFGTGFLVSGICAIILSALLFSMAHHNGPPQTPADRQVFLFRAASGVVLGISFLLRGGGTSVSAHALYNALADLSAPGR